MRIVVGKLMLPFVLIVGALNLAAQSKDEKPRFATKDEINLLLTQTERALASYDSNVKMEMLEFGPTSGAQKDTELVTNFREVLSKLKMRPDLFNGPFGFLLIINLDDATHNMSVCASQGVTLAVNDLMDKKIDDANRKMHVGEVCRDAEMLFYTISENAVNLYSAALLANNDLMQQSVDQAQKCAEILKGLRERKK